MLGFILLADPDEQYDIDSIKDVMEDDIPNEVESPSKKMQQQKRSAHTLRLDTFLFFRFLDPSYFQLLFLRSQVSISHAFSEVMSSHRIKQ